MKGAWIITIVLLTSLYQFGTNSKNKSAYTEYIITVLFTNLVFKHSLQKIDKENNINAWAEIRQLNKNKIELPKSHNMYKTLHKWLFGRFQVLKYVC